MSHKTAKKLRKILRQNESWAVEFVFGQVKKMPVSWRKAKMCWRLFDSSPRLGWHHLLPWWNV